MFSIYFTFLLVENIGTKKFRTAEAFVSFHFTKKEVPSSGHCCNIPNTPCSFKPKEKKELAHIIFEIRSTFFSNCLDDLKEHTLHN